jgi:hypothetical protein
LQESAFELGERGAVLLHVEQAPVVPHMAEAENRKLPYELIFRCLSHSQGLPGPSFWHA